jgi:hypothetical protein
MLRRSLLLVLVISLASDVAIVTAANSDVPIEHGIVHYEAGRFGGWPANSGAWVWGNEILVSYEFGYYKAKANRHSIDTEKSRERPFARSLDGGQTWTIEINPLFQRRKSRPRPKIQECPGINFAHPDLALTVRSSRLYASYDRGKNWQGPYRIPDFDQHNVMGRTDYIVNGKNDCMFFLTATKTNGKEGRPFCAQTTDGGKTFNFVSWIAPEPTGYSIMPSTVRVSKNKFISAIRRYERGDLRQGWIGIYESLDNGQSWKFLNKAAATGTHSGNPPSMIRLRDGRLCVTYGYRSVPFSIRARISSDEGKTWDNEIMLRDDARSWDLGYTRTVQRADGKIVTIYYIGTEQKVEQHIACTIWDPDKAGRGLGRIRYNNPGLTVDLGVGLWAWPLPMDYDGDGDNDLVISCPDKPYNGTYFFENTQGNIKMPLFAPALRLGNALRKAQVSFVDGKPRVLVPGKEVIHFHDRSKDLEITEQILSTDSVHSPKAKIRANQWKYCDYDGDGKQEFVVGIGEWTEYGWDNAFDSDGNWTRGPLHGYVNIARAIAPSTGRDTVHIQYLHADKKLVDVYGMPSPNFEDFDGDGDLDLLCGEFIDKFTYFENIGTRTKPKYAAGRFLTCKGDTLKMDLCMIIPVALDWDKDGDIDLIVGQEDGRVALIENTGKVIDSMPQFLPAVFFKQQAQDVKFGALVTPHSIDWDADGDEDLICGNTAGYVGFIENLDGGNPPKWGEAVYLKADGKVIHIQAGPNGSIQGPCEAKWGYTTLNVADWDGDDLLDIVINSIWGKVLWYRNIGTPSSPKLTAAKPIEVEWTGKTPKPAWTWWEPKDKQLATQWRTTPVVIDLNKDNLNDLVMLDHEGYLAFFERTKKDGDLKLLPPKRIFKDDQGVDGENFALPIGTSTENLIYSSTDAMFISIEMSQTQVTNINIKTWDSLTTGD